MAAAGEKEGRRGARVGGGGFSLVVLIWGRPEQVRCVVATETAVGDVREKRGA